LGDGVAHPSVWSLGFAALCRQINALTLIFGASAADAKPSPTSEDMIKFHFDIVDMGPVKGICWAQKKK
jgi:hypothetical protein